MKITVLGSATGMAAPDKSSSAYAVEAEGTRLLADCGDGCTRQLLKHGVDLTRLDAVIITHTHADHAAGLFLLMQSMNIAGRTSLLPIYLPGDILPAFKSAFALFHIYPERWPFPFELRPMTHQAPFSVGPVVITPVRNGHLDDKKEMAARHGTGADAFSLILTEANRNVILTSDIDGMDHLDEFYDNNSPSPDALISELCHISSDEIDHFVQKYDIPRVVITHYSQDRLPELAHFQDTWQKARDGFILKLD